MSTTIAQFTAASQANYIKFGLLLTLQIPSVLCFLWIFSQLIRKSHLRKHDHHHAVFLLLVNSFLFVTIPLSFSEAFLYRSYVYPSTQLFCSVWICIQYSLNIANLFLMAFASIERNWLIFYPKFTQNTRRKFLFHYCPLVFCFSYPFLFYVGAIFIYQCQPYYDYQALVCALPCYIYNRIWGSIDQYFNTYVPLFSIPVFCLMIYIRVFIQKRSMKQQAFKWRRDRKMIVQLWLISSLYLSMWMPMQLCIFINVYLDRTFLIDIQINYLYLFPYLVHLLYPFIVLIIFKKDLLKWTQNATMPIPMVALGQNTTARNLGTKRSKTRVETIT